MTTQVVIGHFLVFGFANISADAVDQGRKYFKSHFTNGHTCLLHSQPVRVYHVLVEISTKYYRVWIGKRLNQYNNVTNRLQIRYFSCLRSVDIV